VFALNLKEKLSSVLLVIAILLIYFCFSCVFSRSWFSGLKVICLMGGIFWFLFVIEAEKISFKAIIGRPLYLIEGLILPGSLTILGFYFMIYLR